MNLELSDLDLNSSPVTYTLTYHKVWTQGISEPLPKTKHTHKYTHTNKTKIDGALLNSGRYSED